MFLFWSSLIVLISTLVFQLGYRFQEIKNSQIFKFIFFSAICAIFFFYIYLTYAQYLVWKNDPGIGQYFVPPYESITYVISYHFARFLLYYLISLFVASIFLLAAKHYNRKFQNKFFENEEPYLAALSIFLLGNPAWHYAWIYYFIAVMVMAAIFSYIFVNLLKKMERFPLYYLWLPTAILVIILVELIFK